MFSPATRKSAIVNEAIPQVDETDKSTTPPIEPTIAHTSGSLFEPIEKPDDVSKSNDRPISPKREGSIPASNLLAMEGYFSDPDDLYHASPLIPQSSIGHTSTKDKEMNQDISPINLDETPSSPSVDYFVRKNTHSQKEEIVESSSLHESSVYAEEAFKAENEMREVKHLKEKNKELQNMLEQAAETIRSLEKSVSDRENLVSSEQNLDDKPDNSKESEDEHSQCIQEKNELQAEISRLEAKFERLSESLMKARIERGVDPKAIKELELTEEYINEAEDAAAKAQFKLEKEQNITQELSARIETQNSKITQLEHQLKDATARKLSSIEGSDLGAIAEQRAATPKIELGALQNENKKLREQLRVQRSDAGKGGDWQVIKCMIEQAIGEDEGKYRYRYRNQCS